MLSHVRIYHSLNQTFGLSLHFMTKSTYEEGELRNLALMASETVGILSVGIVRRTLEALDALDVSWLG
jgi:hypothetical protein